MAGVIGLVYASKSQLEAWVQDNEHHFSNVQLDRHFAVFRNGTMLQFFHQDSPEKMKGWEFSQVMFLSGVGPDAQDVAKSRIKRWQR